MRTRMKKRVLLVDDDFAVLAGLTGALVSEGYDVVHAADGDEAVEKFRNDEAFDLVLLDLNMPKKSGWEAFEQITAIDPFMPVIVITARPDQYATALAAGVGALIEKPLDLPFLLQKMQELMRETAQDRLARMSGRNPNLSYCPAPKNIEDKVVGQVISPAKGVRRLNDPPSIIKTAGLQKVDQPLDRLLKAWTGCSESERQSFLEEMNHPAGRSNTPGIRHPGPRIVEADFFLPEHEVEENSCPRLGSSNRPPSAF
jgi:CheY-like chemotaxis protein